MIFVLVKTTWCHAPSDQALIGWHQENMRVPYVLLVGTYFTMVRSLLWSWTRPQGRCAFSVGFFYFSHHVLISIVSSNLNSLSTVSLVWMILKRLNVYAEVSLSEADDVNRASKFFITNSSRPKKMGVFHLSLYTVRLCELSKNGRRSPYLYSGSSAEIVVQGLSGNITNNAH